MPFGKSLFYLIFCFVFVFSIAAWAEDTQIEESIEEYSGETHQQESGKTVADDEEPDPKPKGIIGSGSSDNNGLNEGYSPLNVYTSLNSVEVSPQNGSVNSEVTDLVLIGKNGFDLVLSRHYDSGTAKSDIKDAADLKPGDIYYSMGIGWRLNLPYVKKPDTTPENWTVVLPSGASYSVSVMENLGTTNPLTYEYHKGSDFRFEYYAASDLVKLTMKDGTWYEMRNDGLVSRIQGRVDGIKGGEIIISYITGTSEIDYIQDTMNRKVHFTYATYGNRRAIESFHVTDELDNQDLYQRKVTYTITDDRLLHRAAFSGNAISDRLWQYEYELRDFTEYTGGQSHIYNNIPLLKTTTNPEGGKTEIRWYGNQQFNLKNINDWAERALAQRVALYDKLDEFNPVSTTNYTYTTAAYSTNETYIAHAYEKDINHSPTAGNIAKERHYTYEALLEDDHVMTLLKITEIIDPKTSTTVVKYESSYDKNTHRIIEDKTTYSENYWLVTKYLYDNWGNPNWIYEYSKSGDRKNKIITWEQYLETDFTPAGPLPSEYSPASWKDYPPGFGSTPTGSPSKIPRDLLLKKETANYYPGINQGSINNLAGLRFSYACFEYDTEGQMTGIAEWSEGKTDWLYTKHSYYDNGRLKEIENPLGHKTLFTYNDAYSASVYIKIITEKNIEDISGVETDIISYGGYEKISGWPKWGKNPRGYVTEYEYDPLGRVIKIIEPNDNDTIEWEPDGSQPAFRNDNPGALIIYNDEQLWSEVFLKDCVNSYDEPGRKTRYEYSSIGKISKIVQYLYDNYDYLPEVEAEFSYDGWHQLVKQMNPANGAGGSETYRPEAHYRYDILGRPAQTIYDDGNKITMSFDYSVLLMTATNERGFQSEKQYDTEERVIRERQFGQIKDREIRHYFDGLANTIITIDARGGVINYTYNELNQLIRVDYPEETFHEKGSWITASPYTRYKYNDAGYKIEEIFNMPVGGEHTIFFTVDDLGRVIRTSEDYTDPERGAQASVTEIYYDANGNKLKVFDANNTISFPLIDQKWLEYTYSAKDQPLTVKDPEGFITEYTYYPDGKFRTETDPRGKSGNYPGTDFTTEYIYDDIGRLIEKKLPRSRDYSEKPTIINTYYSNGNIHTVTAPDGGLTSYTYTSRNWLETKTISGDGKVYIIQSNYDESGNEVMVRDARGYETTKQYDEWNRLIRIYFPEGNDETYEYDVNDNITRQIDGNRHSTDFKYDLYNRLIKITDAKQEETRYGYDRLGNPTYIRDAQGKEIIYTYDELNRLVEEVRRDPANTYNFTYTFLYDKVGNLIAANDPRSTKATYVYDDNNRLITVDLVNLVEEKQNTIQYEYDEGGNRKRALDGTIETMYNYNNSGEYEPDPYGRIQRETAKIDGRDLSTEYSYDKAGRIKQFRGPSGENVIYQFNKVGELIRVPGYIDQDVVYDLGSLLESAESANGIKTNWQYDRNNRLVHLSYDRSGSLLKDFTFIYDDADNIVWKNDIYYDYDELNQLKQETRQDNIYTELSGIVGSAGLDLFGRLYLNFPVNGTELVDLDYASSSIGVDLGEITRVNRVELFPDSPIHRVKSEHLKIYLSNNNLTYNICSDYLIWERGDGVLVIVFSPLIESRYIKIHCSLDDRNDDLSIVNKAEFKNRVEDLIKVYTYTQTVMEETYSYDEVGNRTNETTSEGGHYLNTYYPYNNLLKTNRKYGFEYDANGNMIKKGTNYDLVGAGLHIRNEGEYREYSYDLMNRLVSVSKNGLPVASYYYNSSGKRVKKASIANGTTYYAYNMSGQLVYEEKGIEYKEHIYAFGRLFSRVDGTVGQSSGYSTYYYHNYIYGMIDRKTGSKPFGPAIYFYCTDHLGSAVLMTNNKGFEVWSCDYTAFGNVISNSGSIDAAPMFTGKDYDEDIGLYYYNARWYDPETGRFVTEDPAKDGLNWYIYAGNNPVKYTDPTGMRRTKEERKARRDERRARREARRADRWAKREARREKRQQKSAAKAEKYEREGKHKKAERQRKKIARSDTRAQSRAKRKGYKIVERGGGSGFGGTSPEGGPIWQTNSSLRGSPQLAACYFRSYQYVAEGHVGRNMTVDEINAAYDSLTSSRDMGTDYTVYGREAIVNDAFERLGRPDLMARDLGTYNSANDLPSNTDATVLRRIPASGQLGHAVTGDARGNQVFDPYGFSDMSNHDLRAFDITVRPRPYGGRIPF